MTSNLFILRSNQVLMKGEKMVFLALRFVPENLLKNTGRIFLRDRKKKPSTKRN